MIYEFKSVSDYLKDEFNSRVRKNPRYSLRSFAQFLKIHPAELSQIFSGKRNLSLTSAKKVSQSLGLSNDENQQLFLLLQKDRGQLLGIDLNFQEDLSTPNLEIDKFSEISEWYHFAILNLVDTIDFQWNSRHISKRLGITPGQAATAMSDLSRLGLVHFTGPASKKKTVVVSSALPSSVIKKYHHQMLEQAQQALDEIAIDRREFQSIGIVASIKDLPSMKKDIDTFTNKIIQKYHKSKATEVYQLQICLFPLTKEKSI
jgi:uncharacterized protein (TIGR02147 family)